MIVYVVYREEWDMSLERIPVAVFLTREGAEQAVQDLLGDTFDEILMDPEYERPGMPAWDVDLNNGSPTANPDIPRYVMAGNGLVLKDSEEPVCSYGAFGLRSWRCLAKSREEAIEKCRKAESK